MKSEILRFVAGGVLALVSTYIGLMVKRGYAEKVKFYKDLVEFCGVFKGELSFSMPTVTDFCTKYVKDKKGKWVDVVKEYQTDLTTKGKFDRDLDKWEVLHLKKEEKSEILHFLHGIGKTSLTEQISFVDKCNSAFASRLKQAEEDMKKKGSMYFKLFALLGVALLVILG